MLLEIESSEEFFELLTMLKFEGRQVFTLHHPRKKDRWLWLVDVEGPKTAKVGQMGLDLDGGMPIAAPRDARHAICTTKAG